METNMIPADFKKSRYYNEFDDEDFDSDNFYEDDSDQDGQFVLDFNEKTSNSNNQITNDQENTLQGPSETYQEPEKPFKIKKNKMVYEINNNYFLDDSEFILDDLKYAITAKNLDQVKQLITDHKLDINCMLKSNWIPLMYAVSCGSFELTEYLVKNGANVNFSDDTFNVIMCASGCTDPSASEINLVKIVELLISYGADINSYDKYYQTPLMYACRAGNTSLIECMVKYEVDLNAKDDNDWTSLSHASSKGNYKCVHKLLKLGADPLIPTIDYLYPFDLAKKYGYNSISELIRNYLRVKKVENMKAQNCIANYFENDAEEEPDDCLSFVNQNKIDDLESFLNALKLSNLVQLFRVKNVTMQTLVNFSEEDLKNVGVLDNWIRQLILNETRKFHHKNWLSTSLLPVKTDTFPNCNEAIAIVQNISRHIDYITQNVKFIQREGIEHNPDLFADDYLTSSLYSETKKAFWNCNSLLGTLNCMYDKVKKEVKSLDAEPIDLVKPKGPQKWYKNPYKLTAFTSIAFSTVIIVKTKFFS